MDKPRFIYGTAWKEGDTQRLTRLAIETGFRGIDTANQRKHYWEDEVGLAIASSIHDELVDREELFLQTKFTYLRGQDERIPYDPEASFRKQVEQSFESSLEHLRVDFIESYLLHGPHSREGLHDADREVWRTMEGLLEDGRIGAVGISNVTADQLDELLNWAHHPPSFVQNRCYASTGWDHEVRAICDANDIVYEAFSLLTANRDVLETSEIRAIAGAHEKTVPQVIFRFAIEVGMVPLTGTSSEAHMREDLAIFGFDLSDAEVRTIEEIALRG